MGHIFNIIIVLVSSIFSVAMGVACIVAVFNAIKTSDLFAAIIYLPFGVIMIAGGGMILLWLLSELPQNVVLIGISVAVTGGLAYWVRHSKLSIADIWKNSTPVLWQSIKVFAKMLLGLALLVGVVWGAVELLDSFGNTTDIISLASVLVFVLSAIFLIKFKTTRPRKVNRATSLPPKKPQLSPLEKKANQLWKSGDPKNNPEDFWAQYESLIEQVKDEL